MQSQARENKVDRPRWVRSSRSQRTDQAPAPATMPVLIDAQPLKTCACEFSNAPGTVVDRWLRYRSSKCCSRWKKLWGSQEPVPTAPTAALCQTSSDYSRLFQLFARYAEDRGMTAVALVQPGNTSPKHQTKRRIDDKVWNKMLKPLVRNPSRGIRDPWPDGAGVISISTLVPRGSATGDLVLDTFLFEVGVLDEQYGAGGRMFDYKTDTLVLMYGIGLHVLTDIQQNPNIKERAEIIHTLETWHTLRCQLTGDDFKDMAQQAKYLSYAIRDARKEKNQLIHGQRLKTQTCESVVTKLLVDEVAEDVRRSQVTKNQIAPRRSVPQQQRSSDPLRADWDKISVEDKHRLLRHRPGLIAYFAHSSSASAWKSTFDRRAPMPTRTEHCPAPHMEKHHALTSSNPMREPRVHSKITGTTMSGQYQK
ncbi:hypothetical protein Micbo1qcDRAFT_172302 [Microdochium bolleyi]|uniref:Uncharacterized protein n=1 Tax=Microdochium bolleyi TaxID=196109 RepID=A0A136JFU1_9PEZI|nr:hypothetical protein Micbo1qcDRAFT_172302 [Microdochium bolleyi]